MYDYEEYYEEDVINESALDMAMDMSDRYGVAIEDAYDFACDAMEGSLKDPRKRVLREWGRIETAKNALKGIDKEGTDTYLRDSAWQRGKPKDWNKLAARDRLRADHYRPHMDRFGNAYEDLVDSNRRTERFLKSRGK